MQPYGIIYVAKNIHNGKMYVGQTVDSLSKRRSAHESCALVKKRKWPQHNTYFAKALRKHGIENFEWHVLCTCYSKEDLDKAETHFITEHYRSYERTVGYNLKLGGATGRPNIRTRQKMSKSLRMFSKANPGYQAGRIQSQETILKRVLSRKAFYEEHPERLELQKQKARETGKSKLGSKISESAKVLLSQKLKAFHQNHPEANSKGWEKRRILYGKTGSSKTKKES